MRLANIYVNFVALAACALCGCTLFSVVPTGRHYTHGTYFNEEATEFLDLPNASRDETVATLGPADCENRQAGVLLYLRESALQWYIVAPFTSYYASSNDKKTGLFITYDSTGRIASHGIYKVGDGTLDEECAKWIAARPQVAH